MLDTFLTSPLSHLSLCSEEKQSCTARRNTSWCGSIPSLAEGSCIVTYSPACSWEEASTADRMGPRGQESATVVHSPKKHQLCQSLVRYKTTTRESSRIPSRNARLVPFLSPWLKGLGASGGQKSCSRALRILHLWNPAFQRTSNISNSSLSFYSLASLEPGGRSTWRETTVFASEVANPFSF